jgi:hypothetical protein
MNATIILIAPVAALLGLGRSPLRFAYTSENRKQVIQVVISLAILASSLYIVLSNRYTPQDKYWALGAVGTILGFSLKESK